MKHILAVLTLSLSTFPAVAASYDEQIDLELEAAALASINQSDVQDFNFLGLELKNPFDFLKNVRDQVESFKQTLILSYDENGNGKIDRGPEFDNFREGMKLLLTLVADKNQNGKVDIDDLGILTKGAFAKVRLQTLTKVCPIVEQQAEAAGFFLKMNPLLVQLHKVCVAHDEALVAE